MTDPGVVRAFYLGRMPYSRAYELQQRLRARASGDGEEFILLLEHEPVITLGYSERDDQGLLVPRERIEARGIRIVNSDRGGKTTYHGPGQLVGYLILRLDSRGLTIKKLVGLLEQSLVNLVRSYSIPASTRNGLQGVWVGEEKVGFVGLNVNKSITTHGFSLNLNNDISPFSMIVPCGLKGVEVTSLKRIKGEEFSLSEVSKRFVGYFSDAAGVRAAIADPAELEAVDVVP